jgi:hypothetical protein
MEIVQKPRNPEYIGVVVSISISYPSVPVSTLEPEYGYPFSNIQLAFSLPLHHVVQTGSGAHSAHYPTSSLPGGKAAGA